MHGDSDGLACPLEALCYLTRVKWLNLRLMTTNQRLIRLRLEIVHTSGLVGPASVHASRLGLFAPLFDPAFAECVCYDFAYGSTLMESLYMLPFSKLIGKSRS